MALSQIVPVFYASLNIFVDSFVKNLELGRDIPLA